MEPCGFGGFGGFVSPRSESDDGAAEAVSRWQERGKAKAIAHLANGLLQKARAGRTTSSIFYLKTLAGWRETERLEHSGPDGSPIEVKDSADRLQVFLERLHQRMRETGHPLIEAKADASGLAGSAPIGRGHDDER